MSDGLRGDLSGQTPELNGAHGVDVLISLVTSCELLALSC
jgi:hypothetical protein